MKKPVFYIIHGWTYTVAPWARTIAMLEKKGLKVEMLHVPGLTTGSRKVWTIEDYVRWADRNLPDGAIALGHSNGGRILLNLCSQKPEKLKQLILLDSAGVYESSTKRDLSRGLSKKFGFLKKIPGFAKVWHKVTGTTDYARAPENMKQTLANMLDSDAKLDLAKVSTPTTILWGAADAVTPPRQAEVMHDKIPNSTLEIFPEWTHAPYISHPGELARAIYEVYDKPPKVKPVAPENSPKSSKADSKAADATAVSAALALKRAPEPVLKNKDSNPVAPDVPTKLVLRKDDKRITEGMRVSDAEGAAVKYEPKAPEIAKKSTDAAEISASASMRRAKGGKTPDIDAASASASLALKKTAEKSPEKPESILAELAEKTDQEVGFEPIDATKAASELSGAITSASVPKVSRLERAKRKVKGGAKPAGQKPKTPAAGK